MQKKFKRKIENFICENCGASVHGNGYTDHCPSCLFSKHVDINPGDRNNDCKGLMEPIAAEVRREGYRIYYRCQDCGFTHRVKSAPEDKFEVILPLINNSRKAI
ncbi:MAG: RNHCP domain-containing protein [Candidatus Dojkabacteria bacterium]|jgi:rubrerythrin|nr:RNHCP domain-containing protein [Candidatus Dojkabacteria bacterium]